MSDETEFAEFQQLELQIFAARDYVVPTEDLRPRVLESARCWQGFRIRLRRWSLVALICLIGWSFCLPVGRSLSQIRNRLVAPLPQEVHQTALEFSAGDASSSPWGMVEAFQQVRRPVASMLSE